MSNCQLCGKIKDVPGLQAELALWKEGNAGCTERVKELEAEAKKLQYQNDMIVAKSDMYYDEVVVLEEKEKRLECQNSAMRAVRGAHSGKNSRAPPSARRPHRINETENSPKFLMRSCTRTAGMPSSCGN